MRQQLAGPPVRSGESVKGRIESEETAKLTAMIAFGDYMLDLSKRVIRRDDEKVHLAKSRSTSSST